MGATGLALLLAACGAEAPAADLPEPEPEPPCCVWVPKGDLGACYLSFRGCAYDAGVVADCERPPRPAMCWSDAG